MNLTERVSYLRGLAEGLKLDNGNKQDRLLNEIIQVLGEIAAAAEELKAAQGELRAQVDSIDGDLSELEDDFYGCGECDDGSYEAQCPRCSETIYVEPEMLDEDEIVCPNCGAHLVFDFDNDEDEPGFIEKDR